MLSYLSSSTDKTNLQFKNWSLNKWANSFKVATPGSGSVECNTDMCDSYEVRPSSNRDPPILLTKVLSDHPPRTRGTVHQWVNDSGAFYFAGSCTISFGWVFLVLWYTFFSFQKSERIQRAGIIFLFSPQNKHLIGWPTKHVSRNGSWVKWRQTKCPKGLAF